ncbi:MAG: hypothetical protein ACK4NR_00225 [Micavibrio sp.]
MITDMDIVMTSTGQIVLVVPGVIPAGPLALAVQGQEVSLAADNVVFVTVPDVDSLTIESLVALDHVDLIAVPDADYPPAGITHRAVVKKNI